MIGIVGFNIRHTIMEVRILEHSEVNLPNNLLTIVEKPIKIFGYMSFTFRDPI